MKVQIKFCYLNLHKRYLKPERAGKETTLTHPSLSLRETSRRGPSEQGWGKEGGKLHVVTSKSQFCGVNEIMAYVV